MSSYNMAGNICVRNQARRLSLLFLSLYFWLPAVMSRDLCEPGNIYGYLFLPAACSTASQFCRSYVTDLPRTHTKTVNVHLNTKTVTVSSVITKTIAVRTGTSTDHIYGTYFPTVGKTNFSLNACPHRTVTKTTCGSPITCGPVKFPAPNCIPDWCSEYFYYGIDKTSTVTSTRENPTTTTVYTKTKTETHTTNHQAKIKVETRTVKTVTETRCITAAPPAQTCGNTGYQYADWTLTDTDYENDLRPWNLTYYKNTPPITNGTDTEGIGGLAADYYDVKVYNKNDCQRAYTNWRFYLYAPQTGSYQFAIPTTDTKGIIWVGDVAYKYYDLFNNFIQAGPSPTFKTHAYRRINLTRGHYYPIRVAWACTGYGYHFYMHIKRPDGVTIEGSWQVYKPPSYYFYSGPTDGYETFDLASAPYIVQYGCGDDAAAAPMYLDWGHET